MNKNKNKIFYLQSQEPKCVRKHQPIQYKKKQSLLQISLIEKFTIKKILIFIFDILRHGLKQAPAKLEEDATPKSLSELGFSVTFNFSYYFLFFTFYVLPFAFYVVPFVFSLLLFLLPFTFLTFFFYFYLALALAIALGLALDFLIFDF